MCTCISSQLSAKCKHIPNQDRWLVKKENRIRFVVRITNMLDSNQSKIRSCIEQVIGYYTQRYFTAYLLAICLSRKLNYKEWIQ